jgi:DNA invertase Pin-like site-specific DNA recombinase
MTHPRDTSEIGSRHSYRCAVYTRKSSEEGLDMAFNSLDAQREAGRDYIKSQRGQGWTPVATAYDDGGYSGGSTDRPGLQHLLADIRAGRVDVVVVYKVDRLSRSLADFARLMQLFDEHGVSFVSVTQQFNTTTSMGRLTLNMLLSFAQFEREVAGERIRDKIVATKRKGVWVCGQPPLGYRLPREGDEGFTPGDRTLRIIETEATLVRAIFEGYLELGSLVKLAQRLNHQGRCTREWTSSRGRTHGGRPLTPQYLYGVLTNAVYIGHITHNRARNPAGPNKSGKPARRRSDGDDQTSWPGLHKPIIDQATWDRVHASMGTVLRAAREQWTHTHLLKGKLRTFEGAAMSPSSVQRPSSKRRDAASNGQKRVVHYYVSQKAIKQGYASCRIKNINAGCLDDLVRALTLDHLAKGHALDLRSLDPCVRDGHARAALRGVVVAPEWLTVELDRQKIGEVAAAAGVRSDGARGVKPHTPLGDDSTSASHENNATQTCPFTPEIEEDDEVIRLRIRLQIKCLDGRRVLLSPDGQDLVTTISPTGRPVPREHIVAAIGLAYAWRQELLAGGGRIADVAKRWDLSDGRVHRLLLLTHLGPDLLRRALRGELPSTVTLNDLINASATLDWKLQSVGRSAG